MQNRLINTFLMSNQLIYVCHDLYLCIVVLQYKKNLLKL